MSYIRRGVGDYERSAFNVEWPYNRNKGMGCAGDTCSCGGTCGGHDGMGLFDSMDPTTWGAGEFIVAGGLGYLAIKLTGDVSKTTRKIRRRGTKANALSLGSVALLGGLGYLAYTMYQKSQAGLGDYQAQSFVNPQILVAPANSAQIRIPAGW